MTQIPAIQRPLYPIAPQPSYNAVKIDIHNPQVNAPSYAQPEQCPPCPACAPVTAPMYEYPKAPIYEVPKQTIYEPKKPQEINPPAVVQEVPTVPPPVIIKPTAAQSPIAPIAQAPIIQAPVINEPIAPIGKAPAVQNAVAQIVEAETPTEKTPDKTIDAEPAKPQSVEVKTPELATPKIDVNEFIAKLTSTDYETQAVAIETIAEMAQNSPEIATELLDTRVIDSLLGIMNQDTSTLIGPTAEQIQIREKIMSGKQVSAKEMADANVITPMEQAERNKLYSIYTVAILEKLYGSEIEKMNNTVVPMTELPGAAGIVEQIKNNKNPMVRAAGIDALSFIQRPEYKQDLTTLFTVAKNDQDINVQQAAAKALEKIAQAEVKPTEKPAV